MLDRANDPTALLQSGGGDRDFNDLVVQLDFTSASGVRLAGLVGSVIDWPISANS